MAKAESIRGKRRTKAAKQNQPTARADRNHRRQRPVFHGRPDAHARSARQNALRRSFGRDRDWHAGRTARGVSGAPRARARHSPSEINYRANICAHEDAGRGANISVSAVGSLREDLPPLDFLIPDQFFDRTRWRIATFFGGGSWRTSASTSRLARTLPGALGEACDARGREGAPRRHVRLHGRTAIFDAGGIAYLPPTALRRDRHDQFDRSQTGARGGTLLRDGRHDHGLRLLAPGSTTR